jgi:hypothetical protein
MVVIKWIQKNNLVIIVLMIMKQIPKKRWVSSIEQKDMVLKNQHKKN